MKENKIPASFGKYPFKFSCNHRREVKEDAYYVQDDLRVES
jgi:hypothetical protein